MRLMYRFSVLAPLYLLVSSTTTSNHEKVILKDIVQLEEEKDRRGTDPEETERYSS